MLQTAEHAGSLEYVVYSYATPIAWRSGGIWTVPDVRYSMTTTQHQWTVKAAVAEITEAEGRG